MLIAFSLWVSQFGLMTEHPWRHIVGRVDKRYGRDDFQVSDTVIRLAN
jgi:hypothetical protein